MAKNDVVVRTPADLERKYNFASLLGLKKNVEITTQGMQKIENELNSMLNALVINLKDVLDSQSEISLWFYSGKPTTSNEPYKSWSNPNDHVGDLYYDINTGYVYKWNGVWEVNTNPDLVEAMAITNAESDTSTDHERKVFFDTPTIPYSNGDWWVKEDGSLFICQISKTSGTYEKDDFIDSSSYVESVVEKIGEEIKVLKGTITMITDNYAKFTDLATGGSTVISGDNITTGVIKSNGYLSGSKGMAIDLDNGTIDSKNLQLDSIGNLNVGGYIESDRGLLTNLQFMSSRNFLGQRQINNNGLGINRDLSALSICVNIPSNFEILSAKVTLKTFKTKNTYLDNQGGGEITNYGKVQNIRLYKESSSAEMTNHWYMILESVPTGLTEISGAFGSSGYTASSTSGNKVQSSDIKSLLESSTVLWIRTADASLDGNTTAGTTAATQQTQYAYAVLDVIGYMKLT